MVGETLDGKYRIIRLLGQGGMGAVYEAQLAASERRVAVKVMHGAALQGGGLALKRFQREARTVAMLDDPHIVSVIDAGADPATGAPFMVMGTVDAVERRVVQVGGDPPVSGTEATVPLPSHAGQRPVGENAPDPTGEIPVTAAARPAPPPAAPAAAAPARAGARRPAGAASRGRSRAI
ncbi:protein kinase [Sorangium sp. So ce296]|uniref:protein kinase n=1 Tax=Sorangium sp. So ce296 TaxID=3133296 RepID=UPI003F634AA8